MSLIRQFFILLASVLLLALGGSLLIALPAARDMLQAELQLKNADNANLLALTLSQHGGDRATMELLMAAQYAGGHYQLLRLRDSNDQVLFEQVAEARRSSAPGWFERFMPVAVAQGRAPVSNGWQPIGRLELASHTAYAHDALWAASMRTVGWLVLVGAAAALAAAVGLRILRRPLDAAVAQATALQEGRFITVPVPAVPELRVVSESMNALVERLRETFQRQAEQVATLRVLAETDPVTGVSNRRHFVTQLQARLEQDDGGGIVIARVADLDDLNRRHGRAVVDAVLRRLANELCHVAGSGTEFSGGRLNGSDFALYLPATSDVAMVARTLAATLREVLPVLAAGVEVHIGSASLQGAGQLGHALSRVDDALADAEREGPYRHVHQQDQGSLALPDGEWRRLIDTAMASPGGLALLNYPVVDCHGRVLHMECPLRLHLGDSATATPAAQWLPHATRHRLLAALDLRAVGLALAASAQDGSLRSVHVAAQSLAVPGFVGELARHLEAAGANARHLLVELPERALIEQPELLQDAARSWSAHGVQVGIEHAGGDSALLARLFEAQLTFVKLDRRHVEGVGTDSQVRSFVSGLVTLLHGMRLKVVAEGVSNAADLAVLWELGFDAATGPAIGGGGD